MIFLSKKFRGFLLFVLVFLTAHTGGAVVLEMTAFDVGQGDCTVFGFRGPKALPKVLLMDAGSQHFLGIHLRDKKRSVRKYGNTYLKL